MAGRKDRRYEVRNAKAPRVGDRRREVVETDDVGVVWT